MSDTVTISRDLYDRMTDALCEAAALACDPGADDRAQLSSMANRGGAMILSVLAELGEVVIVHNNGRCILANWAQENGDEDE